MEGFLEPLWGRCGSCVVGFRASRTWHGCRRGCRRLLLSCLALSPCHAVEERNPRGSDGGSLESKGRLGMGATRDGVREGSGHLGKPDHGQVGLRQVEGQRHPQALSRRGCSTCAHSAQRRERTERTAKPPETITSPREKERRELCLPAGADPSRSEGAAWCRKRQEPRDVRFARSHSSTRENKTPQDL